MSNPKYIRTMAMILIGILFIALCILNSCATLGKKGRTSAGSEEDYARLGLSKTGVEIREDGMRTDGNKGTFEWWYFDTKLEDGSTLVIVFYTKDILDLSKSLSPFITVKMTDKNSKTILEKYYSAEAKDFHGGKEQCDVRIGNNTFSGNLKEYDIHLDFDDIRADIHLQGTTPAWRPGMGHSFFINDSGTSYFAWLPAVPQGKVKGTMEINNKQIEIKGSGYHDHNWGNAPIVKLMHDWYWGRADVGPYTVITAWITAVPEYGGSASSVFFLSRDGKILAENGEYATFARKDIYTDENTGKPVANQLIYDYNDGKDHYRVTYERERDIENVRFIDILSGIKFILGKLFGFDGAYLRFTGKVTIERIADNKVVETITKNDAVWELMYLGHAPESNE